MNKERMLQLAEVLESDRAQKHFDMDLYFSSPRNAKTAVGQLLGKCGTTACVAGWANVLENSRQTYEKVWSWDDGFRRFPDTDLGPPGMRAALWLDLTQEEAERLFSVSARWRTPKAAAQELRRLVAKATGQ